jgi:hypothetical protein
MAWPQTATANKKLTALQRQKGGQLIAGCRVGDAPHSMKRTVFGAFSEIFEFHKSWKYHGLWKFLSSVNFAHHDIQ